MRLRLQEWMDKRNVNQAQVAEGLGVGLSVVNAWVRGKMRAGERVKVFPDAPSLEALCLLLECTPSDLLELEAEATPSGKTWKDFGPPVRRRPAATAGDVSTKSQ